MPKAAQDRVYRRLYDALSGDIENPKFAHLSATDRRAILEILVEQNQSCPITGTHARD